RRATRLSRPRRNYRRTVDLSQWCAPCLFFWCLQPGGLSMAWIRRASFGILVLIIVTLWPSDAAATSILYSNLTPNNQIGGASRPGGPNGIEIESADDFVLTSGANITGVSFIGLVPSIAAINTASLEFYRVFPLDSNTARTPNVLTRTNSPSDVEF